MSLDNHISSIIKSCLRQLRDFRRICPLISKTAAIKLANSFIHSRLDYYNSLFHDFLKHSIHRLRKVQNTAARIVTRSVRLLPITPILKSLHWLPVNYRINFEIFLSLIMLCLHELQYFSSLSLISNSHSLRSSSFSLLQLQYFTYLIMFVLHQSIRLLEKI